MVDSRHSEDGTSIRRRRECLECQKRFTTYEIVESLPIVVIKKDGSRQTFDRNKVLNGMVRACEKRPVAIATLEAAVAEIEQIIQNSLEREVSTEQIGEHIIDRSMDVYRLLKKYADKHGIKIYNATRGGNLEIFPRVKLEDVLASERPPHKQKG